MTTIQAIAVGDPSSTTLHGNCVRGTYTSPLGSMTLAATETALVGAWFEGQKHFPSQHTNAWPVAQAHPVLGSARQQLDEYFAKERTIFDLPLAFVFGTAFQHRVWTALLRIASGATTSYGQLAATLGKPSAARAIGAAVGRNPLSIIVPCHRVVGADGSLTGYAGGLERKVALLQMESHERMVFKKNP